MPYRKKPRWLRFMDRYESLIVLAILATTMIELGYFVVRFGR